MEDRREVLAAKRWPVERITEYLRQFGTIKGVNFIPSYCYGYIEIWQNYREQAIRRELDYAVRIGINSVRIFMSTAQWQVRREESFANLDRFLDECKARGISVMMTLAPGTCIKKGYMMQRENPFIINFRPNMHDASWRFEGTDREAWRDNREEIKAFGREIMTRYKTDDRIAFWDLCNECPEVRREMLADLFEVGREVDPIQPLTACWEAHDISDVITFHCYRNPHNNDPTFPTADERRNFWEELDYALSFGRPALCTECMARTIGNELEGFLPVYQEHKIGFYVWSLVEGSAQYRYPWHWPEGSPEPRRWFHSLLYPDGTPYDESEMKLIKDFHYEL
ncbi:MAG: hypothetical protein IJM76_06235 [Lachnospiraceae bacterium]|nr:hypothetical protein [Lachnospiraceae bacterium]